MGGVEVFDREYDWFFCYRMIRATISGDASCSGPSQRCVVVRFATSLVACSGLSAVTLPLAAPRFQALNAPACHAGLDEFWGCRVKAGENERRGPRKTGGSFESAVRLIAEM